jgi:DNA polymerase-3 subunit epsilon
LAEFFGTKVEPNHRALDDAKATTEVLHGLFERLGSINVTTIDQLLEFARTAAHIQRKNFYGMRST